MQSDREYRVGIHPNLRVRTEYTTDYSAVTLTVEYRRDGDWEESNGTIERRGQGFTITRDGEPLLEQDVSAELLERYGKTVSKVARRLTERVKSPSETTQSESWPVAATQEDGSVVEALRPPTQASFELYEDHIEEWRWRLVHRNGNIIADSGEGYSSKQAARKGIKSVKRNALGAPVEES
ncbi:HVO_2922 family protein [Haladaptatus cibarius]|uniref:HVO_2922 family protein n=1 Tax=Haladaptatus cibarius TaxID=453847 RepID=UPI000A5B9FD5|nr:HVO_2922 family protein [Haladaptatus cibarius]